MKNIFISIIILSSILQAYSCDFTVNLHDTYGDGWNGNSITVSVNGSPVLTAITVATGNDDSFNFSANAGDMVSITYDASGSWTSENEITILNSSNLVVFEDGMNGATPVGGSITISASCGLAPPSNDGPCSAVDITPEPMCNPQTYDNSFATESGIPDPGCANYNGADLWFTATVPSSGTLYIETGAGGVTEAGMGIYTSSTDDCNNLVLSQCIDNGNMPSVTLNSLTPGDIIWIRIWENGGDNNGTFEICITNSDGPPSCVTSTPASDECGSATMICNLDGYCGNTSASYTAGSNDPTSIFCGSIENSSWISFIAGATDATLYVWTSNCANNDGIQMEIYDSPDCVNYSSVSECISPGVVQDFSITATGLVVGQIYYLMIDGFGGDVCDYIVSAGEGVMTATAIVAETGTNTASICSGCVHLEASGGTAYQWSPAASLDDPNSATPLACPTATTTYTVTVTGGNPNCPSNATATTTVNIEANFSTAITTTELACHNDANASITATITNSGASSVFSYEWSNGDATGMIADTTYTISNLSAGEYSVTITEELGCSSVHTITIANPPALSMAFSTISEYCGMVDAQITANVSNGTLPFNFSWTDSGGGVTNGNSNSVNNPIIIQNIEAGNYTVSVTDSNNCVISNTVAVNDSGSVTAGFNINNDQCLEGNSFDFTNTSTVTNGIVYNIISPNSTLYSVNGTPDYSGFTANLAGIWTITQNISSGSCIDATTSTFEVFEEPTLSETHIDITCNAFSDAVINANSTVSGVYEMLSGNGSFTGSQASNLSIGTYTFMVTTANGCDDTLTVTLTEPESFILSTTSTDLNCYNNCDGTANVTVESGGTEPYAYDWGIAGNTQEIENLCAGSYTVTITDFNSCTAETTVTINQPSELTISTQTTPASCFGYNNGGAMTNANGGTPLYSYLWSNGNTTENNINLSSNNYSVTVTDANGCTAINNNIQVDQPNEVILALEYEPSICIGQTAEIRMSVTSSPYSPYVYYWNGIQTSDIITVNPVTTTTYNAQVIDNNGCVSDIKNVTVIVNPPISLIAHANNEQICKGDLVNIEVDANGGNGNYSYRLLDGTILTEPIILSPEFSTDYSIIASDDCGSPEDTVNIHIEVKTAPIPSFHANINFGCIPLDVNFIQDINDHNEGTTYLWNFGDESSSNISFDSSPSHIYKKDGSFHVSLQITSNYGCISNTTQYNYITAFPLPIAQFTTEPSITSIIKPIINFNNQSKISDLALWSFGDGDSASTWNSEHTYKSIPSDYEVTLVALNRFGCSDTLTQKVSVKDEVTIYIPTAFTPDFDGKNEVFIIKGNGISEENFNMIIYDRWGEKIFGSTKVSEGWNGKVKDQDYAKPGIYPYVIKFVDIYGVPHERSGTLNVIR